MALQAVIMAAGRGSRMTDLTANFCKPLLPVANKPLIWYTINSLERSGIQDIIIVSLQSNVSAIKQALSQHTKIIPDIVGIPDDEDWDTMDSLRHIKNKIKTDMLIISCDLLTDIELHKLIDVYRLYNPTVTMLLAKTRPEIENIPGIKSKRKGKNQRDIIALTDVAACSKHVVLLENEADIEDDTFIVKRSILRNVPQIRLKTDLTDAHVYVVQKWVLDYIENNGEGTSFGREFLPYLVRKQFSSIKTLSHETELSSEIGKLNLNNTSKDILNYVPKNDDKKKVSSISLIKNSDPNTWDLRSGFKNGLSCYAHCYEDGVCMRVNSIAAFIDANRLVSKHWSNLVPNFENVPLIHPSVTTPERTQIGNDSIVGEGTVVGERVSIKRSVIGKNCSIASHVKISNCILYDNVKIEKGCHLQNCVICTCAGFGESCNIKDCLIQTMNAIPSLSILHGESIVDDVGDMVEFN